MFTTINSINHSLCKQVTQIGVALVLLCCLLLSIAQAQVPVPNTFVDWPVPNLTDWNDVNLKTVTDPAAPPSILRHSQRRQLQGDFPTDITYIYPDQAARDADVDGTGVGSVAFISWALDDGSGRAPGLQVVTDDFDFPTNNCVMASGERESDDFPDTIVPKTCSDAQGSSKRWFLEVTEADAPVDLVFDTGVKILRYKGVRDPSEDGGAALEAFRQEFGIGRIYRVLGKFLNLTGERIVSLDVQVGTGVGEDFQPLLFNQDGVAFDLRPFVPREFFEGETGAPDITVWDPMRFAAMAPKLFDDGLRPRFDPGFFAASSAGLIPPQLTEPADQSQFIDSGTVLDNGIVGAMTPNHFDIPNNQGATADPPLVGNVFGYLLPDEKAPFVIAQHDDGNPETESDSLVAWWDGINYRYGQAGDLDIEDDLPYGIVPLTQLQQWAALPLGLDPGLTEDPARFEFLLSDDHANANMDIYLHISENILDNINGDGQPKFDNITLRLTAKSVASLGLGEIAGSEDPLWLEPGNEAPPLNDFVVPTGVPVAINDLSATIEEELVNINVLANDLLDGAVIDPMAAAISIVAAPGDGTADLVVANNTIDYTPAAGFVGNDTFTYTVTVDGEVSNIATVKVIVNPSPIPDVPVAVNDSAVTFEATPVAINVLANDSIADGPIPTGAVIEVVDQPVNGFATATVVGESIVYDPLATPPGTVDVFTYRVSVDDVPSNTALVIVRVDENIDLIFADGFEGSTEVFEPDISMTDADINVEVRAAVDDDSIALQFSWPTNKNYAGLLHDIRALDTNGDWAQPIANINPLFPSKVDEDRVAAIFGVSSGGSPTAESEIFGCFQSCHADMNGMPQATVDARHYVIPADAGDIGTYQTDMWHWRGSRSGPLGFAEDTWVAAGAFGTNAQGRQRDTVGPDGNLRENQSFDTEYTVTIDGQVQTIKLPSLVYQPDVNSGFFFSMTATA